MRLLLPFVLSCSSLAACGSSSSGGSPAPDAGDGKYHPAPDGQRFDEATACLDLSNEISTQQLAMMCVATTQPCPELIQSQSGSDCLEYDSGSVAGCVAYYAKAATCDALAAAIKNCVVTWFPGSAPMGCP